MTTPSVGTRPPTQAAALEQIYEHEDTRALVSLVNDAAALVGAQGEAAFGELRVTDSRWRRGEDYVFVLDTDGNMLVHPDPSLEGHNQLGLKDIKRKSIVRGLISAAMAVPGKPEGWYHYEWPAPGGLLPRWKSSYVRLVQAPSGKHYIVGSGVYNDRMERPFVRDLVTVAAAEIEARGPAAFPLLSDPKSPFMVKDAYVFVIDMNGVELLNPAFPNLVGRNLLDVTDSQGTHVIRDMIDLVKSAGSGWVDYMWPRPGESIPTRKSAWVTRASLEGNDVVVGCGVYLADAPSAPRAPRITAPELMALVREAAAVLEERGEQAYAEFRQKGSKWFTDDTYLFVFTPDGTRAFHAAEPETEGQNTRDQKDIIGRPIGQMILDAAASPAGEGWVHYMYPEPGSIFPSWKSTFVKRLRFPSGRQHIVGAGIYNMQMDRSFITDVVDRAAALVAEQGRNAFDQLRDTTGPYRFMDTYIFVESPGGIELVNGGLPSLEGMNMWETKDLRGNLIVQEEVRAAMNNGTAWCEFYWYRPGGNTPAPKHTYVRRVESKGETFIVGSGLYDL